MHRTTPSGERRIWPTKPPVTEKRAALRSSSLSASTVSTMYATVRSTSVSLSARVLPISHISRRTSSSRAARMPVTNVPMRSMRSPTRMVGQAPRPWSHAVRAAARASRAAPRSSLAMRPITAGTGSPPPGGTRHTGERTSSVSPAQVRISPPHNQ